MASASELVEVRSTPDMEFRNSRTAELVAALVVDTEADTEVDRAAVDTRRSVVSERVARDLVVLARPVAASPTYCFELTAMASEVLATDSD